MAAQPVSKARVAAGLAAHAAGASLAEAAAAAGISRRTLASYKAAGTVKPKAKAPPPTQRVARATRGAAPVEPENEPADEALLDTLAAELRYARAARRRAETDAAKRSWSKRIEDLVRTLERLSPPAAPPPDMVQSELRRLDAITIGLIEQFLIDPIKPEEVE